MKRTYLTMLAHMGRIRQSLMTVDKSIAQHNSDGYITPLQARLICESLSVVIVNAKSAHNSMQTIANQPNSITLCGKCK